MKPIDLKFAIEMPDLKYLGRGPACTGLTGWSTSKEFIYRCANCDDSMNASWKNDWTCRCQAMALDSEACRLGSYYGDENILVYKRAGKRGEFMKYLFKRLRLG